MRHFSKTSPDPKNTFTATKFRCLYMDLLMKIFQYYNRVLLLWGNKFEFLQSALTDARKQKTANCSSDLAFLLSILFTVALEKLWVDWNCYIGRFLSQVWNIFWVLFEFSKPFDYAEESKMNRKTSPCEAQGCVAVRIRSSAEENEAKCREENFEINRYKWLMNEISTNKFNFLQQYRGNLDLPSADEDWWKFNTRKQFNFNFHLNFKLFEWEIMSPK